MKKYLVYLLFFCTPVLGLAQQEFKFRNYTISDGLSQSSATCVIQDELSSIWVGTQDGLNRYDGTDFEVFTSDKTPGLESEYIKDAEKDDHGNLWFATNNGLTKYDLQQELFETYFYKEGSTFQIEDVTIGDNDEVWLTTAENGLFRFDATKKQFKSFKDQVPSNKTERVLYASNDALVVSTQDQGIFYFETKQGKIRNIQSFPSVNRIIQDGPEDVIIATKEGVYSLDLTSENFKPRQILTSYLVNQNVVDVYSHPELGWLVATKNKGLFVFRERGEVHHYTEDIFQKSAMISNELNCIFQDRTGAVWVGSQRGVSCFDPNNRGFLGIGPSGNPTRGIPEPSVWSFAEDHDGNLLFIGTNKAVTRYDQKQDKFSPYFRVNPNNVSEESESTVLGIEVINENHLLAACADGLYELKISGENYAFRRLLIGNETLDNLHSRVYSIAKWTKNRYVIATKGGAMILDMNTGNLRSFEHDPSNPKNTISKGICRLAYHGQDGRVWLTTSTGGLNVVEERGGEVIVKPYGYNSKIKSLSKDYITSIYEGKGGTFWMGTFGSGLMKWNEGSKEGVLFNKSHGLPNDVIYGVLSSTGRKLWLSTNKGLCEFDTERQKAKNFTEVNGLLSNEFNLGAFLKGKNGTFYFGGIYGYNFFKPVQLTQNRTNVQVVFSKFKYENEWLKPNAEGSPLNGPLFLQKELNLSYRHRSFTLRFQPSNISNAELVNYKYQLDGSDQGEILLGTNNEIRFNALASGNYTLKIYARVGEGSWSVNPAVMKISISPPFWKTWWFWLIVAAVIAIIVRFSWKQRVEAAARERIRLEMKIRERTKEIQQQNEKIELQKKKIEEEKNRVVEQQRLLQVEKDKTENLLKNVIPESTAEELKKRGKARARAYKTVSVLFTDFVGFTKISERMNPTELVKKLDVYFTEFDKIIVANNLEKIKTIGDAYMCAGGVPVRNQSNPIDTCLAAVQIQAYMQKRKHDAIANGKEYWDLRLGINTGEVTAGVIGSERLAYDIWGATVNQAQRMEMLGEPGKVTISGATFDLVEPYFECTFKGKAQSKSKGLIDMYQIEGIKPELSVDGEGIYPNERFNKIVNLHLYSSINYYKAERHIMRVLEKHLSKKLYYHSIAHTKDVVKAVEHLALLENVTDEGLFLLKSAATYHDAGFIEQYDANEPIGARLAQEILPKYGYTEEHIEKIKELIYVTQIPHKPKNHLEEIMCDADLDYLGREDFHEIADKLRDELMEHDKIKSNRQWDEIQIGFLKMHRYFTKTSIDTRLEKKLANMKEVEDRLAKGEYADE